VSSDSSPLPPPSAPEATRPSGDALTVLLSYIEKVERAFVATAAASSRFLIADILLSSLLIFLSLGIVSANDQISLSGLEVSAPLWALLIGGALLTLATSALFLETFWHARELNREITSLYSRAGYEFPRNLAVERQPWGSFGPLHSMVVRSMSKSTATSTPRVLSIVDALTSWVVIAGMLLLPTLACAAATVVSARSLGAFWAWALLAIPCSTAVTAVSSVMRVDG
jgi:hypothetical protein